MASTEQEITFRTLDGLHLAGTLVTPAEPSDHAVVLVHGGGVTREEGGFFTRLAAGLGDFGLASLRFDLRGHGESEGRQEELTLSAMAGLHVEHALAALRAGYRGAAVDLKGHLPPHAITETHEVYRLEGQRLTATARSIAVVRAALSSPTGRAARE